MSSTTYVYLDTKDSMDKSNPADSKFLLNFQNLDNNKATVSLDQVSIPLVVSPVNINNKTLILEENNGATSTTLNLTEQSYTGPEIAAELKTKLDAASLSGNTFTVSYSSNTKKLTITASTTNFRFGSSSSALKVIGFSTIESYATTKTSTNVVRLDGSIYYDIITSLSSRNIASNGKTNILARIPLLSPFGSIMTFQNTNKSDIPILNRDIDIITIRLIDDEGHRVIMPENSDISYVFRLDTY